MPKFSLISQKFVHRQSDQTEIELNGDEGQGKEGDEADQQRVALSVDALLVVATSRKAIQKLCKRSKDY